MPLLRRFTPKRAEPKAFEELLSEHLDALYRTALRLCEGREADAEDLLQDAMIRAFERFAELRDVQAARAWLFTIVVRTNLNRLRGERRRREFVVADLGEQEFENALADWHGISTLEEEMDRSDLRAVLAAALDTLAADLRTTVWLADVEGFRQREIASMFGVPEGTVASRLYRARRELRLALANGHSVVRKEGIQ